MASGISSRIEKAESKEKQRTHHAERAWWVSVSGKVLEVADGREEGEGEGDEEHTGARHPEFFLLAEISLLVAVNEEEGGGEGAVHRAVQPRHFRPADERDEERERDHDQEEGVLALFFRALLRVRAARLRLQIPADLLQLFRHIESLLSMQ